MKKPIILLWLIIFVIVSCEDEEALKRNFPRVLTNEVSYISSEGALFSGEISDPGTSPIIEIGFVWSKLKEPTISDEQVIISDDFSKKFEAYINTRLQSQKLYYLRAYAKNQEGYLAYGPEVKFKSLGSEGPVLYQVDPPSGTFLDEIEIHGKNFSRLHQNNKVLFNQLRAETISVNDTLIRALVPKNLESEKATITVNVAGNPTSLDKQFILEYPKLLPQSDSLIIIGDTVNLVFDQLNKSNNISLSFNDKEADILDYKKDTLTVSIPIEINNEPLQVNLKINKHKISKAINEFKAPIIEGISPKIGNFKDTIKIYGKYFNAVYDPELQVIFNGRDAIITDKGLGYIKILPSISLYESQNIIEVMMFNQTYSLTEKYQFYPTEIYSVSPNTVFFGQEMVIEGNNIFHDKNYLSVLISGYNADIISHDNSKISFTIPDNLNSGSSLEDILVISNSQEIVLKDSFQLKKPEIYSVNPLSGSPGDIITINGKGFNPRNLSILFSEDQWEILGSSYDQITTRVYSDPEYNLLDENYQDNLKLNIGGYQVEYPDFNYTNDGPFTIKDIPEVANRYDALSFTFFGKVYMGLGGNDRNAYLDDFISYDPITEKWEDVTNYPGVSITGQAVYTATEDERIFMGLGTDGCGSFSDEWYDYSVDNNAWIEKKKFPGEPRAYSFGWTMNEKVYIIGGYSYGNSYEKYHNDLWEYDIETDSWKQLASLPAQGRRSGYCFGIDDKLYVGSGFYLNQSGENIYLDDFWEYNVNKNTWTSKASRIDGSKAKAFVYNNKGYLLFGESRNYYGLEINEEILSFDPATDSWHTLKKPPIKGRVSYVLEIINNTAYIISGTNKREAYEYVPIPEMIEWDLSKYNGY